MKKLNGSAATYFNNFYKGLTRAEICELIENNFIKGVQRGVLDPDNKNNYMKWELRELAEAEAYFSKVKWDKPQTFSVDPDENDFERIFAKEAFRAIHQYLWG